MAQPLSSDVRERLKYALASLSSGEELFNAVNELIAAGQRHDRGELFMSKLINGSGSAVLQVNGDSTGNQSTEWVYQLAEQIGTALPNLAIDYYLWNTGTSSYDLTALQAGASPSPGVLFLDNFNRTASELFGTIPDIGAAWGREGASAAGDWTIDGTKAVRSSDTVSAGMLADGGVGGDIRLTVNGTISTAATGTAYTAAWAIKRLSSTNRISLTISVSTTGVPTWTIVKVIDGVTSTVVASAPLTALANNTSNQAFALTFQIAGLTVTATIGASTLTGTILQSDADTLSPASVVSLAASPSTSMTVDLFRIDLTGTVAPQKLSIYNCSIPASNLSVQQAILSSVVPVAPDLMIASTGHNYSTQSAAQFATAIDSFLAAYFARFPDAGVLITSQNPQKAPAPNRLAHYSRQVSLRSYCAKRQIGYVPLFEKWNNQSGGGVSLIDTDGVHPTQGASSGSSLWASTVKDFLFDVVASY